ncbi:aminotransferase class I/II-fold pyridoxal phosphate-dependent enzyme [Hyphomicrobium sp. 2TAF46]|uniref:aminotransferase class I/II-fold pyridoxal phosphate-dependent enzyme n=1 Tax=Hyphomicrobium sp. 2TAF46 TaxID=3233019 RepID=UPI003F926F07
MSNNERASLAQYARRRFVLSGTSVVKDQFPYCRPSEEWVSASAGSGSTEVVSFAHYDYLGLAENPRVREAAKTAIDTMGPGTGASRLVGGELRLHRTLEREFAGFLGVEDTLALVSGYGANVTLVSHLLTKGDIIFVDEACHNSIMVGAELSRADVLSFRHNDLDHLRDQLARERSKYNRALVVVEGLYSMDGDIPDLPSLIEICRRHQVWLMIDEAHSIGVLGSSGRGITEHYGIDPSEIDLIIGTLSKAFVSCGGFIAGKRSVVEWLRYTLPGFVYSVGLSPSSAAAALAALSILQEESTRLVRLRENSEYFAASARAAGLNLGNSLGIAVVPIFFDDVPTTMKAAGAALDAGYYVSPIVQIAVPRDGPRLRFFITAKHEKDQLDGVLNAIKVFPSRGHQPPLQESRKTNEPVAC